MNQDEIVQIRRKEVHVHPGNTNIPPVGQGLSKPAKITLHRILSIDKETRILSIEKSDHRSESY